MVTLGVLRSTFIVQLVQGTTEKKDKQEFYAMSSVKKTGENYCKQLQC